SELHGGDEPRRLLRQAEDEAGAAAALLLELVHPRAADGDERVLAGDEERVQQHERRHCDQLEEESHAPSSRAPEVPCFSGRKGPAPPGPLPAPAQVLGGTSYSKEATAEYR